MIFKPFKRHPFGYDVNTCVSLIPFGLHTPSNSLSLLFPLYLPTYIIVCDSGLILYGTINDALVSPYTLQSLISLYKLPVIFIAL